VIECRQYHLPSSNTCRAFILQLDRYQEQPHLLDTSLREIVGPVMAKIRDKLRTWHATQLAEAEAAARAGAGVSFPFQVPKDAYLHTLFRLIYGTCKTRGYKAIVKLFPHEVADLEPALQWLLCQVSH